jgi:hypothetical protein
LERAKRIELSYAAWEAAVLPLNYAREPFQINMLSVRCKIFGSVLHTGIQLCLVALGAHPSYVCPAGKKIAKEKSEFFPGALEHFSVSMKP